MKPPDCPFCRLPMHVQFRLQRQGWVCNCGFAINDDAQDVTVEQAAEVVEELKR